MYNCTEQKKKNIWKLLLSIWAWKTQIGLDIIVGTQEVVFSWTVNITASKPLPAAIIELAEHFY